MTHTKEQNAPPDVVQKLIEGFQFDTQVKVPGPNGDTYLFTIGVLWDDEVRALQREIGFRIQPNDFVARELETRFETVLRSIISIIYPASNEPVWDVISKDLDAEEMRFRREYLRDILDKLPRTVEYLYQEYQKLVTKRDKDFDEAIEDIKKSSRTQSLPDKLKGNLPNDSESGEAGGS